MQSQYVKLSPVTTNLTHYGCHPRRKVCAEIGLHQLAARDILSSKFNYYLFRFGPCHTARKAFALGDADAPCINRGLHDIDQCIRRETCPLSSERQFG